MAVGYQMFFFWFGERSERNSNASNVVSEGLENEGGDSELVSHRQQHNRLSLGRLGVLSVLML